MHKPSLPELRSFVVSLNEEPLFQIQLLLAAQWQLQPLSQQTTPDKKSQPHNTEVEIA